MTTEGLANSLNEPPYLALYRLLVAGAIVIGLPFSGWMANRMVQAYDEGQIETRAALKEINNTIGDIRDQQINDAKDIKQNIKDIDRLEQRLNRQENPHASPGVYTRPDEFKPDFK